MRERASLEQFRSDEEVIGTCTSNPAACEELYRRFFSNAVEIARAITSDDGRAQELVQETFTRLIAGDIAKYQAEKGAFLNWLAVVMRNRYHTLLRRGKYEQLGEAVSYVGDHSDASQTPEAIVGARELRRRITEALNGSSATPEQVEALILYEVEGLTYQEIADRQRVKVGTVMSRISRARQKAKAALGELYNEVRRAA